MKKSKLIVAILCLSSFSAGAQFLYAIGAAGGISYSKEGWIKEQFATQEKYLLGPNGAILAEFVRDPHFRWRSEIMYNGLGTKEVVVGATYSNATNYISFNNYLRYQYEFFNFKLYTLIGPRLEYLLSRSAAVFPQAIDGMYSLHVSGAAGVGIEKVCYGHVKPFAELFYNHDIMPSFKGDVNGVSTTIMQHDFELRVGLKYVFDEVSKCPHVDNSAGNPVGAE